jgi:hypothetical protein
MPGQGFQISSNVHPFPRPKCANYLKAVHKPHFLNLQYVGLQILEKLITTRWKSLPEGQRQGTSRRQPSAGDTILIESLGIRNFVVGITVKIASDENLLRKEKTYINKLNLALVQVCSISVMSATRSNDGVFRS